VSEHVGLDLIQQVVSDLPDLEALEPLRDLARELVGDEGRRLAALILLLLLAVQSQEGLVLEPPGSFYF